MLLTTHLMEEAEVLCDRVGIINKGQLRCVGEVEQLKERFGRGYRLSLSLSPVDQDNISLLRHLAQKYQAPVKKKFTNRVIIELGKQHVIACLKDLKRLGTNWTLSQASLYDIFIEFV